MNKLSKKTALVLASAGVLMSNNAFAGELLQAAQTATTDFKADLTAAGGLVIGIALISVGVGLMIRMFRKA